jgi:hypothetical protein
MEERFCSTWRKYLNSLEIAVANYVELVSESLRREIGNGDETTLDTLGCSMDGGY